MISHKAHVEIREFQKLDLRNYTLIEGFPGIGLVGTIAAKYLIEKLNMQKLGYIHSDIFVPMIRVREGKPVYPSRLFVSREKKLLVMISEQIIPNNNTNEFALEIIKWVKEKKISRIISLNGIQSGEQDETVYGIGSNDKSVESLRNFGTEIVKEGITTGISAVIMLELKTYPVEALSLLASIKLPADYKAAAVLVKKLNEILGLQIDIGPLMKEAKKTEDELTSFIQSMKQQQQQMKQMENSTMPNYTT